MERGSVLCGGLDGGRVGGVWVSSVFSHSVKSDLAITWTVACQALMSMDDSLGKNTGVGCHALLQGIPLTQGSNPSLPHCRCILYHLSQQGGPWGEMDACMCMAECLRYLPETTTALLIGYTPIHNNKFKVWTK